MDELLCRISACIPQLLVLLAVVITGVYAVKAAERHALGTELVKLRYGISTRHMNKFHKIADPLRVKLTELPYKTDQAESFLQEMYPHSPFNVRLYAELATLPEHWDRARSIEQAFSHAIDTLASRLKTVHRNPDSRSAADSKYIADWSNTSAVSLMYLMRVVDLSSQIRLSPSDPAARGFDAMLRRWNEAREVLPSLPSEAMTGP